MPMAEGRLNCNDDLFGTSPSGRKDELDNKGAAAPFHLAVFQRFLLLGHDALLIGHVFLGDRGGWLRILDIVTLK